MGGKAKRVKHSRVVKVTSSSPAGSYAADHSDEPSEGEDNYSENEPSVSENSTQESEIESEDNSPQMTTDRTPSKTRSSSSSEACTFDLRNLVAINSHQVSSASLYPNKRPTSLTNESTITIPSENLGVNVNEDCLLEKAREGCTQLLSALWDLPTERSDAGPMVTLPDYSEIKIPRALPPPPPKKETKWEKFAKERGIAVNKEKRSRKVWDEATGSWMYRHGYQKANNDAQNWPIMEVKGNDDPYADPWEKMRDEKRSRVEKNMESRMRNQERAGLLTKGTATRVAKNREKIRNAGKTGGNADRDGKVPIGVPVDLQSRKGSEKITSLQRGKESTKAALLATQRSTASLGRFDKMREGEPERRKALEGLRKRKFATATDRNVASSETEKGMKLLNSVVNGGGVAREKAKRNGSLATGETAYDYDFDDGLGAGSFKKKKGRAAAGKIKKITKKRRK